MSAAPDPLRDVERYARDRDYDMLRNEALHVIHQETERCAAICEELAALVEQGGNDLPPGGRLRQAARLMRSRQLHTK